MYRYLLTLIISSCLLIASCGHPLESESGLYDVQLEHNLKMPVKGWWAWGKGNPLVNKRNGKIYVAPLDISKVQESEPELSALLIPQMHDYMVAELSKALEESNAANKTQCSLTEDPKDADIRIDMAIVHLRPQHPILRIMSSIGSYFSPIPGTDTIAGTFTNGDICMEATVRDARTNELWFAMKDSNSRKTYLYEADAYKKSGQADKNLRHWAHKWAMLFRGCAPDKLGNRTLKQAIEERSLFDGIKARID